MWVKICGNTSLGDAQLAVDAGADALGFVFAPSPRRVSVEQVAAITEQVPAAIERIGIFVESPLDEIVEAVETGGLTGVQLHAEGGAELPAQLRARFGPELRILRVVHFGGEAESQARTAIADPNVDGILVDSRTATAVGGTGIPFDWAEAAQTVFRIATEHGTRIVAAGGLSPVNVAEAIATLKPWGVDVVSGVEAEPGRKDPEKVRKFVENARKAL
ncbi:MAG: phosphoribosylanthranilate isomerase [Acidobacteriota bacterium]|nr:phosphoribosylanthranilate isomerase [Acidobacteriota bacterium]